MPRLEKWTAGISLALFIICTAIAAWLAAGIR